MATTTSTGTEHLSGDQFGAHLAAYRKNIIKAGYGTSPKQARSGNTSKMNAAPTQNVLRNTMRAGVRQAGYNQKSAAMNSSLAQTGGSMYAPAKATSPSSPAPSAKSGKTSKVTAVKSALRFGRKAGSPGSSPNPSQAATGKKGSRKTKIGPSRYAGKLSAHLRGATGSS